MKWFLVFFLTLQAHAVAINASDLNGILYASDDITVSQALQNPSEVCSQIIPLANSTFYSITITTVASNTVAGSFSLQASNDGVKWVSISSQVVSGNDNFLFNITNAGYLYSKYCYTGTAVAGTFSAKYTRKLFRN